MNDINLVLEHRMKIATTLLECIDRMYRKSNEEALAYMREQNASLIDWLQEENRWLAVIAGEKVEPKQIPVHAVLHGTFGDGT